MMKNTEGQPRLDRDTETTEELVGVLTAISIVSKRLARRLVLLDEPREEGGEAISRKRNAGLPISMSKIGIRYRQYENR